MNDLSLVKEEPKPEPTPQERVLKSLGGLIAVLGFTALAVMPPVVIMAWAWMIRAL